MLRSPLVIALILSIVMACGKKSPPQDGDKKFHILGHPTLSYSWLFPTALTGEPALTPNGWTYRNENGSIEGTAWVAPLPENITKYRVYTRQMIRDELDKIVRRLLLNGPFLATVDANTFSLSQDSAFSGLDRLDTPVEIRVLDLQLGSLDEKYPSFIADWAAKQMGGKAIGSDLGSPAGSFKIVVAMAPLISPFLEVQEDANGTPLGFYAIWVAVPARLPNLDDFNRVIVDFAEVLPIASKFSAIAVTENILQQPETDRSIALIAAFDHAVVLLDERERLLSDFMATLARARPQGTELRVGIVRTCDEIFIKSPGADDFVSSFSAGFNDEISARFNLLFDISPLECLANMPRRSAALAAIQSGSAWEQADDRWFFWFTKRPDIGSASLGNLNIPSFPNEYSNALRAEKASFFAVGPAAQVCNDADKSTSAYEPDVAKSFRNQVDQLTGAWFEYCDDWSQGLGDNWAARTSVGIGLKLGGTPLPGTLTVYSGDVSLPVGTAFGYTLDRATGALIPGASITFGPNDLWRAVYETLQEPDTSEL